MARPIPSQASSGPLGYPSAFVARVPSHATGAGGGGAADTGGLIVATNATASHRGAAVLGPISTDSSNGGMGAPAALGPTPAVTAMGGDGGGVSTVPAVGTVFADPLMLLSDPTTRRLAADIAAMPQGEPILQGMLRKEGTTKGSWKRRWFVLRRDALQYLKRQDAAEVQGTIPLDSVTGMAQDTVAYPQSHTFQLLTAGRTYALQAPLEAAQRHWLSAIAASILCRMLGGVVPPPVVAAAPDVATLPSSHVGEGKGGGEGDEEGSPGPWRTGVVPDGGADAPTLDALAAMDVAHAGGLGPATGSDDVGALGAALAGHGTADLSAALAAIQQLTAALTSKRGAEPPTATPASSHRLALRGRARSRGRAPGTGGHDLGSSAGGAGVGATPMPAPVGATSRLASARDDSDGRSGEADVSSAGGPSQRGRRTSIGTGRPGGGGAPATTRSHDATRASEAPTPAPAGSGSTSRRRSISRHATGRKVQGAPATASTARARRASGASASSWGHSNGMGADDEASSAREYVHPIAAATTAGGGRGMLEGEDRATLATMPPILPAELAGAHVVYHVHVDEQYGNRGVHSGVGSSRASDACDASTITAGSRIPHRPSVPGDGSGTHPKRGPAVTATPHGPRKHGGAPPQSGEVWHEVYGDVPVGDEGHSGTGPAASTTAHLPPRPPAHATGHIGTATAGGVGMGTGRRGSADASGGLGGGVPLPRSRTDSVGSGSGAPTTARPSRLRVEYAKSWINVLGVLAEPFPLLAPAFKLAPHFHTGVLLCNLLEAADRTVRIEGVNPRPRAKASCMANIEKALRVMWKKAVRSSRIPVAEDVYEQREDRVTALLPELYETFALRRARTAAPTVLAWWASIAMAYGLMPPSLRFWSAASADGVPAVNPAAAAHTWQGLWDDLHDGTLLAIAAHWSGEAGDGIDLTQSFAHPTTAAQREANWSLAAPALHRLGVQFVLPWALYRAGLVGGPEVPPGPEDDDTALLQLTLVWEVMSQRPCRLTPLGTFASVSAAWKTAPGTSGGGVGVATVMEGVGGHGQHQVVVGHAFADVEGWTLHQQRAVPTPKPTPSAPTMPPARPVMVVGGVGLQASSPPLPAASAIVPAPDGLLPHPTLAEMVAERNRLYAIALGRVPGNRAASAAVNDVAVRWANAKMQAWAKELGASSADIELAMHSVPHASTAAAGATMPLPAPSHPASPAPAPSLPADPGYDHPLWHYLHLHAVEAASVERAGMAREEKRSWEAARRAVQGRPVPTTIPLRGGLFAVSMRTQPLTVVDAAGVVMPQARGSSGWQRPCSPASPTSAHTTPMPSPYANSKPASSTSHPAPVVAATTSATPTRGGDDGTFIPGEADTHAGWPLQLNFSSPSGKGVASPTSVLRGSMDMTDVPAHMVPGDGAPAVHAPPAPAEVLVAPTPAAAPAPASALATPTFTPLAWSAPHTFTLKFRGTLRPCTFTLHMAPEPCLQWTTGPSLAPGSTRVEGKLAMKEAASVAVRTDMSLGRPLPCCVIRVSPAALTAARNTGGLLLIEVLPASDSRLDVEAVTQCGNELAGLLDWMRGGGAAAAPTSLAPFPPAHVPGVASLVASAPPPTAGASFPAAPGGARATATAAGVVPAGAGQSALPWLPAPGAGQPATTAPVHPVPPAPAPPAQPLVPFPLPHGGYLVSTSASAPVAGAGAAGAGLGFSLGGGALAGATTRPAPVAGLGMGANAALAARHANPGSGAGGGLLSSFLAARMRGGPAPIIGSSQ